MADRMTPEQRRRCMSRIRGRDTKPELVVRRWLWHQGFRYRLYVKSLPGRPDIVMRKWRTAIFVNGCFWHGHDCRQQQPTTNAQFWQDKIARNRERDARNQQLLRDAGWHVIVVWECQLSSGRIERTMREVELQINNNLLSLYKRRIVKYAAQEEYAYPVAAEGDE